MSHLVKVLLIEDDEDDYVLIQNYVRSVTCCKVILDWVDRYEQALNYIAGTSPDLILVDYNLNQSHTGIDLVREVKNSGKDIPAILVTGLEKDALGGDGQLAVVDEYLNKRLLTAKVLEETLCSFLVGDA